MCLFLALPLSRPFSPSLTLRSMFSYFCSIHEFTIHQRRQVLMLMNSPSLLFRFRSPQNNISFSLNYLFTRSLSVDECERSQNNGHLLLIVFQKWSNQVISRVLHAAILHVLLELTLAAYLLACCCFALFAFSIVSFTVHLHLFGLSFQPALFFGIHCFW